MLNGRNRDAWERTDWLMCASFNSQRLKKDWVKFGSFNPFRSRDRIENANDLNHETAPHIYYSG